MVFLFTTSNTKMQSFQLSDSKQGFRFFTIGLKIFINSPDKRKKTISLPKPVMISSETGHCSSKYLARSESVGPYIYYIICVFVIELSTSSIFIN